MAMETLGGTLIILLCVGSSLQDRVPGAAVLGSVRRCAQSCPLLLSVCPVSALLFALICSACVHCLHSRKGPSVTQQTQREAERGRGHAREEEGLNYATLEVRKGPKRSRAKPAQSTDFCTYSEINSARPVVMQY
ncbi:hypothetical protein MATL_G00220270 [Megalops atlanticus]|uniref:Uncharacterized protein n=1 Tax=Megalops atlanticus TaxID=7932 RepID=A0A9D3PH37_MEGAT|nr:hypothetical protein MATL_G00220270 [Megalops atlanticus]